MVRRSGLAPARVERQLARAAEAIEQATGERPAVPQRDHAPDGEPFWELADDVLHYTLLDHGRMVWRWETREVGTLTFWALRDSTYQLARRWEERTRLPGEGYRDDAARDRWAYLMELGQESWLERHLRWLDASDRSGFVGWPNPAEVVTVIDELAGRLARDAGQPHGYLPGVIARDDAQPWIETHGDELNYRVRAGDRDLRDDRTTDITELLFWVFEPVTREMARAANPGAEWRTRWAELMGLVNPQWREMIASLR
ncbi:hypothetical protein GCM10027418_30600 [Mariniluteicoccus endophyticus]